MDKKEVTMRLVRENEIQYLGPRANQRQSIVALAISLLLSATILVVGPAGNTAAAVTKLSDADIAAAVETGLRTDPAVSANLIDVAIHTGIATLSGSVPDLLSKERAAQIAESVKGVRAVVNTLEVMPRLRSDQKIRRDIEDALLADPAADSYEIGVSVDNGIATLTG
ncbi:MAG: BON domain-containing protein, partial [Desulfobacteraceae bacterium]|nr:BON domain-containing protein [Desulfobacteraceae bacterium]